jgi:tetratricopeptide (TPR) repeat protein
VRRWGVGLVIAVTTAAILGYGYRTLAARQRAQNLRLEFTQALERRDFLAGHALVLHYLELCPKDVSAHLLAAQVARRAQFQEPFFGPQTDLLREADRHLDDCARLNGPEETIAIERALLRVQQGEFDGVEEALLAFVQTDGADNPLILEGLIHGYLRTMKVEKARSSVEKLLALQPDNAQALVWRGQLKEQLMNFAGAREDYEEAVRLNPDFDSAHYYLVGMLLWANQAAEAAKHLTWLENSVPENLLVRQARALCQVAMGQSEGARKLLDNWLRQTSPSHPRKLEALVARSDVALMLDQPVEAEQYARQALRISPLDHNALYSLYRSLIAQGHHQEAAKVQTVLDRIKNDLQYVAKGPPLIAQSPDDLSLQHQLGEAYLRLGRTAEALIWFMSVLDRDPAYRPTLKVLADYYERVGDARQASEFRQRLAAAGQAPPEQ